MSALAALALFAAAWAMADATVEPAVADSSLDGQAVACYASDFSAPPP